MNVGRIREDVVRIRLRTLLVMLALVAGATTAATAPYPERPIRIVVPYPPGGATDVVARLVAEKMSGELGQQIFVDNRPGAGTMIGATAVARSAADGYTLLVGDTGTYALNPTLYDNQLTYDPAKDFAPVCRTGRVPLILVANPKAIAARTVADLVKLAKADPGKIDYGAPGPGAPLHLAMELFRQRVGIKATPIPYKGGADALADLLGGRIAIMFVDAATGVSHIKSGALTALAASTDERIATIPDVPTVAEAGVPDFEAWAWNGLAAPAGTPGEVIVKLSAACRTALSNPALQQRFSEINVESAPSSPEEFTALIRDETAKWRAVITEAGISLK